MADLMYTYVRSTVLVPRCRHPSVRWHNITYHLESGLTQLTIYQQDCQQQINSIPIAKNTESVWTKKGWLSQDNPQVAGSYFMCANCRICTTCLNQNTFLLQLSRIKSPIVGLIISGP